MIRRFQSRREALLASVVTTDGSAHLDWQVRLLRLSHERVRQPGRLDVVERTVRVADDDYPPYSRPVALEEWAAKQPAQSTAVVLDPDMIFLRRRDVVATRGAICAHDGRYPVPPRQLQVLRRHGCDANRLPIPIVPMVLTAGDLEQLCAPWLHYTKQLRADSEARMELGWLCEMWACALAVRDSGLRCDVGQLASVPPLRHPRRAFMAHYAWVTPCFDKRTYRPWTDLPRCPHRAHGRMRSLIADLRHGCDADAA